MRSRTNRRHAGDGTLAAIGNLPRAAVAALFAAMLLVLTSPALAAPEAKILRIDPRAAQTDGAPIITTVVEVAQRKRISDATADCAYMRGDAQLTCMGERLAQPGALFTPFSFPPKENVIFTVAVDGADQPAKFVDAYKWEQAQNIQGVGTAWLIVIDAAGSMGARFGDAQQVALAFINSMQAQDIANVTVIGERGIITDSKWQPASAKAQLATAVTSARELPKEGRARPLMTTIRAAATDGFKDLGNAGTSAAVPLHQAMVVLSNGQAGGDVSTNGLGATQLAQYLTKGRFPEDNPTAPKMPLPVISILFPTGGLSEEFTKNAQDFMTNLANPEIGGYFGVVRGNGAAMGVQIVNTVRYRFNQMWVVRWRVSCVAPTVLQTFNLLFKDVNPQIAPDGYKDVPVGIDPTTWPLDVNVAYTAQMAKRDPVYPGGSFKVYGDFCWGSNAQRAAVYFIPKDTAPPAAISGRDVEGAKKAQQQLVARKMDGKAIKAADTFVEFEAPESETILIGKGEQAVVRVVLYDNVARRMSGVTANTILTLKGSEKPLPIVMIVAASFGGLVVILLIVAIIRGGGSKKQRGGPPQGPSGGYAPPGPAPYGPPGGGPPGYGQPAGGPPPGYGQAGAPPPGYGAAAAPPAYAPPPVPAGAPPGGTAVLGAPGAPGAPAPAAASPDFMYGGKPPQYGLTTAQPQGSAPPPDPYGGAPAGGGAAFAHATRATLSGAAGVFTILPGSEMRVGRDAAQCQIVFQEARVSGFHATVKLEGGQFLVRDEGSNNGTHVNGTRLAPKVWMPVPPGSMVRFGPVELSVRIE